MCFKYFTRTAIILNLFSSVLPGENIWYNIKYNVIGLSQLMEFLLSYVILIPTK